MATVHPELTEEQRKALEKGGGIYHGESYVLMTIEHFREAVGAGTDEDFEATCRAIDEAVTDLDAGQGISFDEFKRRVDAKHGV